VPFSRQIIFHKICNCPSPLSRVPLWTYWHIKHWSAVFHFDSLSDMKLLRDMTIEFTNAASIYHLSEISRYITSSAQVNNHILGFRWLIEVTAHIAHYRFSIEEEAVWRRGSRRWRAPYE